MKVLVISNFYPPHYLGGQELRCQEVVAHLRQRGHQVAVLTSRYQRNAQVLAADEPQIDRLLHLESDIEHYRPLAFFTTHQKNKRENLHHINNVLLSFQPDLIFVWGMWNLSKGLIAYFASLKDIPVVYAINDTWPCDPDVHTQYWRQPARHLLAKPFKQVANRLVLRLLQDQHQPGIYLQNVICISYFILNKLRTCGVDMGQAVVIHAGVDPSSYAPRQSRNVRNPLSMHLVSTCGLGAHKGADILIEALALLKNGEPDFDVTLTLFGTGHPDRVAHLTQMVDRSGLAPVVHFLGQVPRESLTLQLSDFDIFVFPVFWEEPLGRAPMEAMLAGLPVITTMKGGIPEYARPEVNVLSFAPGDARTLAAQIQRLAENPDLRQRLAEAGRQTILQDFTLDRMLSQIEDFLQKVAHGA